MNSEGIGDTGCIRIELRWRYWQKFYLRCLLCNCCK